MQRRQGVGVSISRNSGLCSSVDSFAAGHGTA